MAAIMLSSPFAALSKEKDVARMLRDLIEDLDLQWILLGGIAGGVPVAEFTQEDIVAVTRLTDFSVKTASEGRDPQSSVGVSRCIKMFQDLLTLLPAMSDKLGNCTLILQRWFSMPVIHRILALMIVCIMLALTQVDGAQQQDSPSQGQEVMDLIRKAQEAEQANHWDEALKLLQQALRIAHQKNDHTGEAIILASIGSVYATIGQPQKALEYFKQTLNVVRDIHERPAEAGILNDIGVMYDNLGQPQQALEYYTQALSLQQDVHNRNGEATTLHNIGKVYDEIGQSPKALEYYNQALTILKEVKNYSGEATTLTSIGLVFANTGQPLKALEYYTQAMAICKAIKDRIGEARILNNMGLVYGDIGQPEKALERYTQALPTIREAHDRIGEARTLHNMGLAYVDISRFREALECYTQALPIIREAHDRRGEAAILNSMGYVYFSIGQSPKALHYYTQALPIDRETEDRTGEARALNYIALVYVSMGQPLKALEYLTQVLPIIRAANNRSGEATTLHNIGAVYANIGQPQKALEYYNQALPIRDEVHDSSGIAATLSNMGLVYDNIDQPKKALECYTQALPIMREAHDRSGEARILHNIGLVYDDLGLPVKALEFNNEALSIEREVQDRSGESATLSNMVSVYIHTDKPAKALETANRALALYEEFTSQIWDPSRLGAFQQLGMPNLFYQSFSSLLVSLKHPEQALSMTERGRTRGLAKLAAQSRLNLPDLLGQSDAQQWNQALLQVATAEQMVQKAQSAVNNFPDSDQVLSINLNQARTERLKAETKLSSLQQRLNSRHPDFARLMGAKPLSYAQLTQALLSPANRHTLFLEYAVTNRSTMLFAFSRRDGLHVFSLPIGYQSLLSQVKHWQELIDHNQSTESTTAHALYDALLLPLFKSGLLNPDRYKRLVIVPDGPLQSLPFAALLNHQGHRLVQDFDLSYAFSLSMLTWPSNSRQPTQSLLAIANPTGEEAPPLPEAQQQADKVVRETRGAKGLYGPQATRDAVLSQMGSYALLHFGTHAESNPYNGLRSYLLLTPTSAEEDGHLEASEIASMALSARMAVLSACETAIGEESGGEGLMSLAWAFRAAGCPSIVASLWKVEPAATAALMERFYGSVLSGRRVSRDR